MCTNNKILLIIVFTLLAISCSKDNDGKEIKIGFSQAMTNDDWRRSMNNSMILQASLNPNIKLTIYDANYDVAKQIDQIEKLIADSLDVIIVSPIQSKPITPVVKKALKVGIPVLVIDRKTEGENYTAYLGADNFEVGKNAAKVIVASDQRPLDIIEIKGLRGSSPAEERSLGFNQIINNYENINVIATIEGDWEKESIEDKFKQLLKDDIKVDYVFAHNDRMAKGAWDVARSLGKEKRINFIGVDGLNGPNGGIKLVKDGILNATILYPTGGDESINLALKILNGQTVSKNNILASTIIDQFNADIMKNQLDKINEKQKEIQKQINAIKIQEEKYYSQRNLLTIAMALLIIVLSLAIYSIYSIFTIRKKTKLLELNNEKITVQRNQIEKIANEVKLSNEAKLNFFTGLSHEFKTPLTLILSSIESIYDVAKVKKSKMMSEVELIYNNSNRLLRLINNLLDFRKVEDKNFNIRASNTNIYKFSKNIFNDFEREAKKRNIKFNIDTNNKDLELFIDRNLMDKVYFNLLSNAFKFTPDNGKIEIYIKDNFDSSDASIHVIDNGIGIPKQELTHIFEPFFKGSNNRKNSSGIGLHLSKQFIDLHLGKIMVKSLHGTEFIINLFKGNTHFNEDQIITEPDLIETNIIDFSFNSTEDDSFLSDALNDNIERPTILIIEDNRDLSIFLKNKFVSEYEIYLSDGTDAIEQAFEIIPDIVLCDINLPGKSGFEICEILKKDLRTSHIPTIILTALSNKESYLKGLESGADLYLTKPFSYAILIQSIKSLLYNREKLRYYYTNNIYRIGQKTGFGLAEQDFIFKVNEIIKSNIDNSSFSVEDLAEQISISRVQLYRKMKAILNISISDYIQDFRLVKAKKMLNETKLTISEIAYSCGFSSPNYFSTSFKSKYGVTPIGYRKSIYSK